MHYVRSRRLLLQANQVTMASMQRLHVRAPAALAVPKNLGRRAQTPVVKLQPCRALDVDWADPDTWIGIVVAVGGLGAGIGVLVFSEQRIDEDEKQLEDLRKLNRETFKETGQYLTKVCCAMQWFALLQFCVRFLRRQLISAPCAGGDRGYPDAKMDRQERVC